MIEGEGFTMDIGGPAPDYSEGRPAHTNTDACPACAQQSNLRAYVKDKGYVLDLEAAHEAVGKKMDRLTWYGADQHIVEYLLSLAARARSGEAVPDLREQVLQVLQWVAAEDFASAIAEGWRKEMLAADPWSGGTSWTIN